MRCMLLTTIDEAIDGSLNVCFIDFVICFGSWSDQYKPLSTVIGRYQRNRTRSNPYRPLSTFIGCYQPYWTPTNHYRPLSVIINFIRISLALINPHLSLSTLTKMIRPLLIIIGRYQPYRIPSNLY